MAEAGATDSQIGAVSGHSIEKTRAILKTYIPRMAKIAARAIAAWEKLDRPKDDSPTADYISGVRDLAKALKLARAGVPTDVIAAAFGWTFEDAARLLEADIMSKAA